MAFLVNFHCQYDDGTPIQGALCEIYGFVGPIPASWLLASGTTDANGFCTLETYATIQLAQASKLEANCSIQKASAPIMTWGNPWETYWKWNKAGQPTPPPTFDWTWILIIGGLAIAAIFLWALSPYFKEITGYVKGKSK